jgi:hypothetical protein
VAFPPRISSLPTYFTTYPVYSFVPPSIAALSLPMPLPLPIHGAADMPKKVAKKAVTKPSGN